MRVRFAAVLAALFSINLAMLPVVDAARTADPGAARIAEAAPMASLARAGADRRERRRDDRNQDERGADRPARRTDGAPGTTDVPEIRPGAISQPTGRLTTAAEQGARYIVVFRDEGIDSQAVLDELMAQTPGIVPTHVYAYLVSGFAAFLTPEAKQAIERDPRVKRVEPDVKMELIDPLPANGTRQAARAGARPLADAQTIPTGVVRVGGVARSDIAKIDGIDDRIEADIAIIDTGVDLNHPDLNVFAYTDCTPNAASEGFDLDGHGTHVAGTAAAIDNGSGVVGVAPGARIWVYRVMDDSGEIWTSYLISCLGWAAYDTTNPFNGQTLDVANISIGGNHADGSCTSTDYHEAICDAVAAGLTIVVAAGNDAKDANGTGPATYGEVITVSNMADQDGKPGGLAGTFTRICSSRQERDDGLASTSNFGADIDIAAPGIDVLSTYPRYLPSPTCAPANGYAYLSGTSMAAPHVAGAAAIIKARKPSSSPADVKQGLVLNRHKVHLAGDPDGLDEGVLAIGPTDTVRPAVAIGAIADNTVAINASDAGSGVARVDLRYCAEAKKKNKKKGKKKPKACTWSAAKVIGSDLTAPYEIEWTTLPRVGKYLLIAQATDGAGNAATSATHRVIVSAAAAGNGARSIAAGTSLHARSRPDPSPDAEAPEHAAPGEDGTPDA